MYVCLSVRNGSMYSEARGSCACSDYARRCDIERKWNLIFDWIWLINYSIDVIKPESTKPWFSTFWLRSGNCVSYPCTYYTLSVSCIVLCMVLYTVQHNWFSRRDKQKRKKKRRSALNYLPQPHGPQISPSTTVYSSVQRTEYILRTSHTHTSGRLGSRVLPSLGHTARYCSVSISPLTFFGKKKQSVRELSSNDANFIQCGGLGGE